MNTLQALDIIGFGIVAIFISIIVLLFMVHKELGPAAGLGQHRSWLLAAALGSGILAFSFKILLIVVLSHYPRFTAEAQKSPQMAASQKTRKVITPVSDTKARYIWDPITDTTVTQSGYPARHTQTPYTWQTLPMPARLSTEDEAKVALGERLFFDTKLSADGSLSCASCHDIYNGAGNDGRKTAVGINGHIGRRNTPTVWNTAYQSRLFWDGRAASLEEQALGPLLNPIEMGMPSAEAVVDRVVAQERYKDDFSRAFGEGAQITVKRIAEAIAAFERTLITDDTPYDHFVRGELRALTPAQRRGMELFESVGCVNCHSGPNFSAASRISSDDGGNSPLRAFPAISTPYEAQYALTKDKGAAGDTTDRGIWRVPSLRNVALTAPYFHNGAVDELEEAVRIMAAVQLGRTAPMLVWSNRNKQMHRIEGKPLGEQAIKDIVVFLHALSSDTIVARIAEAKMQRKVTMRYAAN